MFPASITINAGFNSCSSYKLKTLSSSATLSTSCRQSIKNAPLFHKRLGQAIISRRNFNIFRRNQRNGVSYASLNVIRFQIGKIILFYLFKRQTFIH